MSRVSRRDFIKAASTAAIIPALPVLQSAMKPQPKPQYRIVRLPLPKIKVSDLDAFTRAYIESLMWSTQVYTDDEEEDDRREEYLDHNYSIEDWHPDALAILHRDCRRFQDENNDLLIAGLNNFKERRFTTESDAMEQAGHDFCMSRGGHGCGFWDGDWPDPQGQLLHEAAKEYEHVHSCPYVGGAQIHLDDVSPLDYSNAIDNVYVYEGKAPAFAVDGGLAEAIKAKKPYIAVPHPDIEFAIYSTAGRRPGQPLRRLPYRLERVD